MIQCGLKPVKFQIFTNPVIFIYFMKTGNTSNHFYWFYIIQDNFLIAKRKFSCQNLDLLLTKLQDLSDQCVTKAKRQKRNVLISVLPCSCQERALLFIVSASRLPWPWYNKPLITNDYNLYPARIKTGKNVFVYFLYLFFLIYSFVISPLVLWY